jgi:hypothetical protein
MTRSRRSEAGYALLLVYAMAAMIAIMLYMQLPRVAFEAQRDKEQLLIDRGEQYSRAVQLFVRKYNRYPQDIAALENTQSIRFLRKQYKDPITGKDEWRLIHVGPGGIFTDSLIYGQKKKGDQNAPQTFIAEMQQIGGNTSTGEGGVNQAARRRASDQPGAPGNPNNDPNNAGQIPAGPFPTNGQPFPGNNTSGISGPVMVLPDGRIVPANYTGQAPAPGQPVNGQGFAGQGNAGQGIPGQTPGQIPLQPGANGQSPFPPGVMPPNGMGFQPGPSQYGQPTQNGLPQGFQSQPNTPGAPPGAAANIINQILTTPRPGGLNGVGDTGNTGTSIGGSLGGQTIGGGFAGVASKAEQEGIKTYKERTAYNEWEFVYDMTKDTSRNGGGRGGVPGTTTPTGTAPGSVPGGIPQTSPGTPVK